MRELPVSGIRKSSIQSQFVWSLATEGECEAESGLVSWSQVCIHKRNPNFWVKTRIRAKATIRMFNLRMSCRARLRLCGKLPGSGKSMDLQRSCKKLYPSQLLINKYGQEELDNCGYCTLDPAIGGLCQPLNR